MSPISAISSSDRGEKTKSISTALDRAYGRCPWRRHLAPVDELVATILSQHTSDINTERAYASLRARFPSWSQVVEAPTAEVIDAIRTGGLANQKAPRIQAVLSAIQKRHGEFDLKGLASLSIREARVELTSLHGVGPKTASCVLLFSFGMPAIPVDTHVHRVSRRVGLIDDHSSAESAHEQLETQLAGDRDSAYAFHMHLIRHGRTVCTARRPHCDRCPLMDYCDYARRFNIRKA